MLRSRPRHLQEEVHISSVITWMGTLHHSASRIMGLCYTLIRRTMVSSIHSYYETILMRDLVTWDRTYFAEKNASVQIVANYVNSSLGGQVAYTSSPVGADTGYITWTVLKDWMEGQYSNNITLFINALHPIAGESASLQGPTLMITNKPAQYYQQPKTPVPKGQSLYIALPSVFVFILLCVCGGFIFNRKHRKIGLGNIMGRRNGYGVGKSRSQRLGLGKKKKSGAIQLQERDLTTGRQYRDAPEPEDGGRPIGRARADSDALGSLASTPTEERTNYFRDEMRRQEQNRH